MSQEATSRIKALEDKVKELERMIQDLQRPIELPEPSVVGGVNYPKRTTLTLKK